MAKTNSKSNPVTNKEKHKVETPEISARIDALRNDSSPVKAYASANIGGAFAIHGITVIEGKNGTFVSMPQRSYKNEQGETKYSDIFHPVTKEAYAALNESVLDKYHEALAQSQNAAESENEDIEEIVDEDEGLSPSM